MFLGQGLIQALRAFRWAEIIVDAVLFESCVGGVGVAMTVAPIFPFEFWFLWGAFWFACFLCVFGKPLWVVGVPWTRLGVTRGTFGRLFGVFGHPFGCYGGHLWVLWATF